MANDLGRSARGAAPATCAPCRVTTIPSWWRAARYGGIWQECAPQEGLVYGTLQKYVATQPGAPTPLQTARANHMAFFAQQKPDGQLPASIKLADQVGTSGGYGQIQMVVPIAATAWELFQMTA